MKVLVFIVLFLPFSASASTCVTDIDVVNKTDKNRTMEFCLEFDESELNNCLLPMKYEVPAMGKTEINLSFMCGYNSDPKLDEYWILYRDVSSKFYSNIKYTNILEIM